MLISHRFGSVETLSRAQDWLARLGFEIVKTDEAAHDVSRLTVHVGFSEISAALSLIDSIEQADPEGWPGFTTPPKMLHGRAFPANAQGSPQGSRSSSSPIHWHYHEETSPADPVSTRVREYMFSRWE